jgi:hypothetical protein
LLFRVRSAFGQREAIRDDVERAIGIGITHSAKIFVLFHLGLEEIAFSVLGWAVLRQTRGNAIL